MFKCDAWIVLALIALICTEIIWLLPVVFSRLTDGVCRYVVFTLKIAEDEPILTRRFFCPNEWLIDIISLRSSCLAISTTQHVSSTALNFPPSLVPHGSSTQRSGSTIRVFSQRALCKIKGCGEDSYICFLRKLLAAPFCKCSSCFIVSFVLNSCRHRRIAQATIGMLWPDVFGKFDGYLSPSQNLIHGSQRWMMFCQSKHLMSIETKYR